MEDSTLFMQWAMNTLQQEHPAPAVDDSASAQVLPGASHLQDQLFTGAHAANNWSSGGGGHIAAAVAMDILTPSSLSSAMNDPNSSSGKVAMSWNFSAATAAAGGFSELPMRRAVLRRSSAPYAHEHIMAERKRREKINQLFDELSAVIPGLTKMDKATILSNATTYVKELQEDLKAREAAGNDLIETVVLVKKPCHATPVARKPLPDVEARFSGKSQLMVRIHCQNSKGVTAKVLTAIEELHLGIIDANIMSFSAYTLIITITAKVLKAPC